MKLNERGVLPQSSIYIYNSSLIKRNYFYQMLCIGHYWCNHSYSVKPNTLDSYLLLYVISGELYTVTQDSRREVVKAGQMAILNCYQRPSYGCASTAEFFWIHFDSHDISQLYEQIENRKIQVADRIAVRNAFNRIISPFEAGGQPSEAIVNKYITNLLTEFFEADTESISIIPQKKFENVENYINNNLDKKISNEELAQMANMSVFHFIRAFKKEKGFTPHEFILRSRVNTATFLLRATSLSLTEITYRCGFANEAAFSNCFKSLTGMTPLKCRQEAWGKVESRLKLASTELISGMQKRDDE